MATERILLVDPDGRLAAVGTHLADGFALDRVETVGECLHRVEAGVASAVVAPQALPGFDGLGLLRSIRLSQAGVAFVLVPADPAPELAGDAVAAGVDGYVPGGDPERVASVLRRQLRWAAPGMGEAHERYRRLLDASPAPINLFDAEGRSIWGNDAVLELLGLSSRADLVGRSIFSFVHADDHDVARRELGDVISRKEAAGPTYMRLAPPDAEERHILVSTAVGAFLGADIGQAVIVDVTALRRTQRELRVERALLENAIDAVTDVFYVVDADLRLERWNERALAISGYDDADLAERSVLSFFAAADVDRVRESIRRVFATGSDVVEARIETADGRHIPHEFRGRRLRGEDGEPRVVGIGRDVSDRLERERQLRALETWLRHNIRNGMSVIAGVAETLQNHSDDAVSTAASRVQSRAEHLVGQADKQRTLIDLLTSPPDRVAVDLSAVARARVRAARRAHPDAEIELAVDEPVSARAIPQVDRAVAELLENAIVHADRQPPTVRVAVEEGDGDRATVTVADRGPGIPASERETIAVDSDIDQLHHASGLGLLVVGWVMRLSEGDIAFAANEPRGSVVTLTFRGVEGASAGADGRVD